MINLEISSSRLNKNLPVPYYYQIVQILREAIAGQEINQQEISLPSENELCNLFQVNRGTIRHALSLLENEGLIYREKGRGTFLKRRRIELDPTTLCSTSEDLRRRGWVPGARLLDLHQMIPQPYIQRILDLASDETVWEIYRLRMANDEPISLQWSYIPSRLATDLDSKDLSSSLFSILRNDYGLYLDIADQVIRTRQATLEEAALLDIHEHVPVFEITRQTFDEDQRPVEYLISLWRGDRYDLRVQLKLCNS
jgi:GntR family transcriptional regulator